MTKRFVLAVLSAVVFMAAPPAVQSVTLQGIKVDFKPRDFTLKPGETGTKQVTVRNISDKERSLEINVSEHDQDQGDDRSRPDWVEAAPGELTVPAQSERDINLTISVPDDKNLKGEYRAMLDIVGAKSDSGPPVTKDGEDGQASVGISTRMAIGIPIYTTIDGTQKHKLTLQGIGANEGDDGKTELVLKLKNNGTVREHPSVILNFYPVEPSYKDFVVEFDISKILPGEKRTLKKDLPTDKVSPTKYRAMGMIRYGTSIEAGQRTFNFETSDTKKAKGESKADTGSSNSNSTSSDE